MSNPFENNTEQAIQEGLEEYASPQAVEQDAPAKEENPESEYTPYEKEMKVTVADRISRFRRSLRQLLDKNVQIRKSSKFVSL